MNTFETVQALKRHAIDSAEIVVRKEVVATWSNYGVPDKKVEYRAGERVRLGSWRPEGMYDMEAGMFLSWHHLEEMS